MTSIGHWLYSGRFVTGCCVTSDVVEALLSRKDDRDCCHSVWDMSSPLNGRI